MKEIWKGLWEKRWRYLPFLGLGVVLLISTGLGATLKDEIEKQGKVEKLPVKVVEDVHKHQESENSPLHEPTDSEKATDRSYSIASYGVSYGKKVLHSLQSHPKSYVENTGHTLLGANESVFLFKAYGGLIYQYNPSSQKTETITEFGDWATLSQDGQYVLFSKYENPLEEKSLSLYIHYLANNHQEKLSDIPDGLKVTDGVVRKDIITYTARDDVYETIITKQMVVPSKRKTVSAKSINSGTISSLQGGLTVSGNSVYGVNYDTHQAYELLEDGTTKPFIPPPSPTTTFIASFDYSSGSHWAMLYYDDKNIPLIQTDRGPLRTIENPTKIQFLDDNTLLILDDINLILYDLTENESSSLLTGIGRFFYDGRLVSIQRTGGEIESFFIEEPEEG